jgi:hypothetical protein
MTGSKAAMNAKADQRIAPARQLMRGSKRCD